MRKFGLILLLFFTFLACENSTSPTEDDNIEDVTDQEESFQEVDFIPLEVGNYWIYEDETDGRDTTFISKDTTINEETFFKQTNPSYYDDGELLTVTTYYFAYRDSGLVKYDKSLDSFMFYRYPDGETTFYKQRTERSSDRFTWYTKIISTDSTITTEAGTFETLIYHSFREDSEKGNQVDFKQRVYFSEGVGIVKKESEFLYFKSEDMLKAKIGDQIYP